MSQSALLSSAAVATISLLGTAVNADQVINDDLIVIGSICAGIDCVNGEDFGFDTLRMKENNTRVQFNDTSAGSFPTNNWQIRANASFSGGPSFLGFVDQGPDGTSETGTIVFSVAAGAGPNALFVDAGGNVGIGTGNPVLRMHAVNGNTPALRLEQNGSSGFTPQTWDLAGNEINFFVRDVTNGSALPFRIRSGAATSVLDIQGNERVGVNTTSPDATMEVNAVASSIGAGNVVMKLTNPAVNGPATLQFASADTTTTPWNVLSSGNSNNFLITRADTGKFEFQLTSAGNLTIAGALTQNSDKNNKIAIHPIDSDEILSKVLALPISSWTYTQDAESGTRHIGPMAQDFYALFGTGDTDRGISTLDASGVALAAIKALAADIDALRMANTDLSSRLERLEVQPSSSSME